MKGLAEAEAAVRSLLVPGEQAVRAPIPARGLWLVLTDHRFLILGTGRRGHPQRVLLAEPLGRVRVEKHWLWSKLQSGLVVRVADGRRFRILLKGPGTRTRVGMARVLRDVAHDVARWTRWSEVVAVRDEQAAGGQEIDTGLALVRVEAEASLTPAQFARTLGLDTRYVSSLLAERFGVRVSKGATSGYTYTADDRRRFGHEVKEKLFLAIVEDRGADAIVAGSTVKPEWWQTSGGGAVQSLLTLADLEVAHVSARRAPIARWQSSIMWLGLFGAVIVTVMSVGLLIFVPWSWRRSWERWREGTADRPRTAIAYGVVTAVVLVTVPVLAVVLEGVRAVF